MSKLVEFSMANGKLGFALAVESTVDSSGCVDARAFAGFISAACEYSGREVGPADVLGLFAVLNGRPGLGAGAGIPPLPLH